MFGAGTDYCLLLVARYKEDLQRIEDQHEALRHAIPRATPAIVASGLTVAAALMTLVASELDTNQTLGPVTAIGVAIVLVASVTLLPAILGLLGRRGFWPTAKQVAFDPSLSPPEYELPAGALAALRPLGARAPEEDRADRRRRRAADLRARPVHVVARPRRR